MLRLKRKPLLPLGQQGQMLGAIRGGDSTRWDGWISALVVNNEFETAEIVFRPDTGEARVEDLSEDLSREQPRPFDWLDARASTMVGNEQLSVRIHGDTVYDRATGEALWSNPALVGTTKVSDKHGAHEVQVSAVRAIVHEYLVVEHGGDHGGSPAFQVFDLRTGGLRWETVEDLFASFFFTDGWYAVYVGREVGGSVVATDLATGEERWRIVPPGDAQWAQKLDDGQLLVVGESAITLYESGDGH